ncbi:MAG TPA: alpha/beta hydrolase [Candidatus Thermoplasmatota archaeon]|nr:alpha/beta hydrolase [Candidatus Thermoplasmatota archaeon]
MTRRSPKPHQTVVSKDGTRIAYDVQGNGPPLVIVNGALSVRTFTFAQKMADGLAPHFTVYNYDRRGRGDSTDTPPYSVQREVEDLAALCQAAGGKPYVFGQSSGASLALEAAAAGVPMAGLVAYEPPYTQADPADKTDAQGFEPTLKAHIARGERDEAVAYFMRTVGVPGFVVRIMRLLPMWKVMRGVAHTLPYDAAVMAGFKVPGQRLARVRVPTVLAAGEKTTPSLKAAALAASRAVPGAQHRLVPRSNHGIKAAAIAPVLVEAFRAAPPMQATA